MTTISRLLASVAFAAPTEAGSRPKLSMTGGNKPRPQNGNNKPAQAAPQPDPVQVEQEQIEAGENEEQDAEETEGTEQEAAALSAMSADNPNLARLVPFVKALDADDELTEVFARTWEAQKVSLTSDMQYLIRLNADFPHGSELRAALPRVGSTVADNPNNPDKYKLKDSERTFRSFYTDLFERWGQGRELAKRVRDLKLADNPETRAASSEEARRLNPKEREKEIKKADNQYRYARSKFLDAAHAIQKLETIADAFGDKVVIEFPETLEDLESMDTIAPITVRDGTTTVHVREGGERVLVPKNPGAFEFLTVRQLTLLNVEYAKRMEEKSGAYRALIDSISPDVKKLLRAEAKARETGGANKPDGTRETRPEGNETAGALAAQGVTIQTLPDTMLKLATILDTITDDTESRAQFVKQAQTKQGEPLLVAMRRLHLVLEQLYKMYPTLATRADDIEKEGVDHPNLKTGTHG